MVPKTGNFYKTTRDFKNLNYERFHSDLISIPWNNIYHEETIEEKVDFLIMNVTALLNKHAPFRSYKISKKYAPWLTDTLRDMMLTRNRLLTKFKKTKQMSDWNMYKKIRNIVTASVKRKRRNIIAHFCLVLVGSALIGRV